MQLKRIRIIQDSNCSITSLFDRFLLTKQAEGAKTKTLLTYSQHLKAMSYHLDTSLDILEMNKNKYEQMIASMVQSRLSPNSIRSYSITLKAFLSWCNDEGYTNFNIKTYKGVETVKETYTDQELSLLLEKPNMRNTTFAEYRTWVIINLLVNNGCRASTVRNIKIKDLDIGSKVILLRHQKNRSIQTIPLCDQLCKVLSEYLYYREGKPDDYLFPTDEGKQLSEHGLASSIERYNKARGVEKTSVHAFRHTFSKKFLLDCNGNALMLQKLLNHSSLDMTKLYCKIFDADVVKNFEQYSPLAQLYNAQKPQKIKIKR